MGLTQSDGTELDVKLSLIQKQWRSSMEQHNPSPFAPVMPPLKALIGKTKFN